MAGEATVDELADEIADDAALEEDVAEEEDSEPAVDEDPLEAFRRELMIKPGDWYVVHTYSGMENRVLQNLENRVPSLNMEDYIYEIMVPTEEVTEIRNGQRKQVRRTVLPGYVLVRMDLTDESWSTVRHTPSVTGFVGHANTPVPLSLDEVEKMLRPGRRRGRRRSERPGRRHRQGAGASQEEDRGRRLRRRRLGDGGRRSVRRRARDDHRDQRRTSGSRRWSRSSAGRPRST